jgi:hypothetical protein
MNDEHRCEYENCPWVQDANNSNRYVCLRCDREKNLLRCDREKNLDRRKSQEDASGSGGILFMLLAIALLTVLLLNGCIPRSGATTRQPSLRSQPTGQ